MADLHGTIAELRQRGVQFTGEIERTAFGEKIEFIAPENRRWTLARATAYSFSASLYKPHIGWIELKVDRLAEQRAFYGEVLGLQPTDDRDGQILLRQGPGEPLLFLEPGGKRAASLQLKNNMLYPLPSHLISFETDHIEDAATWLRSRHIPILTEITRKEWGGIDFYIADPDNNPIQIVKYIQT